MAKDRLHFRSLPQGIYKQGKKYRVRTTYKGKSLTGTFDKLNGAGGAVEGKALLLEKAKRESQLKEGGADFTLKNCLEVYRDKILPLKNANYIKANQSKVNIIISKEEITSIKVSELTSTHIDDYVNLRRKDKGKGRKFVSRRTIKEELQIIRRALEYCVSKKMCVFNYAGNPVNVDIALIEIQDDKRVKLPFVRNEDGESIEKEWLEACKEYSDGSFAYFVELAIYTACRRGELVELQWQDIDIENRLMNVKNKDPKGRIIRRDVPLSKTALNVLERMGIKKRGRVFETYTSASSITRAASNIRKKKKYNGKFDGISPHTFRHEATTRELNKGLQPHQVQLLTGHKTTQMLDNYFHQLQEQKKNSVDLFD